MSATLVTAAETTSASAAPPVSVWRERLRQRRFWWRLGVVLVVAQFAFLVAFKVAEYRSFALSWDYSINYQAWHLIGHWDLDPYSTVLRLPFWQNDGEFLMWPLALFGLLSGSGVLFVVLQQLAALATSLVALDWALDLASAGEGAAGLLPWAGAAVVALVVFNPWVLTGSAYDWHLEVFYALFCVLSARAIWERRGRAALCWATLALLGGSPATLAVLGVGLIGLVGGRRRWRIGALVAGEAVVWQLVLTALDAHRGGSISGLYGGLVLSGAASSHLSFVSLALDILRHPGPALHRLAGRWLDDWAILAPAGLVGIVSPVGLGALPVLLEGQLTAPLFFGSPVQAGGFQMWPLYPLVAVGTVLVLRWLWARRGWLRRAVSVLGVVLVADVLGWFALWAPTLPSTWLRVSPAASAVLAKVAAEVPGSAEVVASQGIAGRFAGRRFLYPILNSTVVVPVRRPVIWFVFAPAEGIETTPVITEQQMMATVADDLRAPLIRFGAGIWVYRWRPRVGVRSVTLPEDPTFVPASGFAGPAGVSVEHGPPASWYAASTGERGYVVAGDYWRRLPGRYQGSVELASTGPVDLECWNASANRLLGRVTVPATTGRATASVPCSFHDLVRKSKVVGVPPFQVLAPLPAPGNRLELRVWSPGGEQVSVFALWMSRAPATPARS